MKQLSGLLIVLCLIAFISAEGHQSRRQNFKVFKQRRLNPDNLGRRGDYRDNFEREIVLANPTTTTIVPTTTGSPTGSPTSPTTSPTTTTSITSPTRSDASFNKHKNNKDHLDYDQLVNRFDQEDLDDMIELHRLSRKKNRRQSGLRRHRHRQ